MSKHDHSLLTVMSIFKSDVWTVWHLCGICWSVNGRSIRFGFVTKMCDPEKHPVIKYNSLEILNSPLHCVQKICSLSYSLCEIKLFYRCYLCAQKGWNKWLWLLWTYFTDGYSQYHFLWVFRLTYYPDVCSLQLANQICLIVCNMYITAV